MYMYFSLSLSSFLLNNYIKSLTLLNSMAVTK